MKDLHKKPWAWVALFAFLISFGMFERALDYWDYYSGKLLPEIKNPQAEHSIGQFYSVFMTFVLPLILVYHVSKYFINRNAKA